MEHVHEHVQEPVAEPKKRADSAAVERTRASLSRVAQTKLVVGHADDPFEHAADETADLVVRSLRGDGVAPELSASRIQRRTSRASGTRSAAPAPLMRIRSSRTTARREVTTLLQRRAPIGREGGELDTDTERSLQSARGGGSALDGSLQRQMGDVMNADLSGVRLHSGAESRDLNDAMGAQAFTVGSDVFFRDGVPDTGTSDGLGLVAHEVAHTVQQGASPIRRRVTDRDDEKEGAESEESEGESETEAKSDGTEPEAESEAESETEEEAKEDETEEPVLEGTIAEIKPNSDPEDITGAGKWEEDARGRRSKAAHVQRRTDAAPSAPVTVELGGEIASNSTIRESNRAPGELDKLVGGTMPVTGNITGPVPTTDAFGAMATDIKFSGVDWQLKKGKIVVDLTINGTYEWETYGDTCIDITAPNCDVVTKDNYQEIADDLTPQLEGKCWRPPRDKYWSQALTERHEKYHAKDADWWVKKKGPGVVRSYLKKNPIELTDDERKDKSIVQTKLDAVLDEAVEKVVEGRRYYFRKDITDYLAYPGEIRAFGDGKAPYAKLAKGVKAHGKKLEAAAKKAAKAPAAEEAKT